MVTDGDGGGDDDDDDDDDGNDSGRVWKEKETARTAKMERGPKKKNVSFSVRTILDKRKQKLINGHSVVRGRCFLYSFDNPLAA